MSRSRATSWISRLLHHHYQSPNYLEPLKPLKWRYSICSSSQSSFSLTRQSYKEYSSSYNRFKDSDQGREARKATAGINGDVEEEDFTGVGSFRTPSTALGSLIPIFADPFGPERLQELTLKASSLKDQILACDPDSDSSAVSRLLDNKGLQLLKCFPDGSALIVLLDKLRPWPHLALQVFDWRRKLDDPSLPMTAEEYAKGITIAGKAKNVDLAGAYFKEAAKKQTKTASTYNALMGAYMVNGMSAKCQSVFRSFKREAYCTPTIVTYNMLISVFGRLMLVDHMEATLAEIDKLNLVPNLKTYNSLITGYLSAWMWDRMENTYLAMKASSVQPDTNTYMLMLRGYSHSGNLIKMEEMHDLIKQSVSSKNIIMVRTLICAYCKSSSPNRIRKIEELRKLITEDHYRPWLNVLLIKVYAQEGLIDEMVDLINEAIERRTSVVTVSVMRAIITAFFHRDAVDKLAEFVRRAEYNGWRICRSLYHCKMVMYASQNRLTEMEGVLSEMERVNLDFTKKTYLIMYKAYKLWGPRYRVNQIKGMMCKQGYEMPVDECLA
ncbi:hypothetical protein V2J09_016466 [Rumex salicifolius]